MSKKVEKIGVQIIPAQPNPLGEDAFESKTQYDNSYNYIFADYPKAKRGLACSTFAVVAAREFFSDKSISKDKHETNINRALTICGMLNVNAQKTFSTVLRDTNISPQSVRASSTLIVRTEDPDLRRMIPDLNTSGSFCVIILKNAKYFVVMGNAQTKRYSVRDCHEPFQYNFSNRQGLVAYLKNVYSLDRDMVVDGVSFPEYSSIEYVLIDHSFNDTYNEQIEKSLFQPQVVNQVNNNACGNAYGQVGSACIGFVENAPPDDTDMEELQRKFGGVGFNDHNVPQGHGQFNNYDPYDEDYEQLHDQGFNRGPRFARNPLDDDDDDDDNNHYTDDDDEFFDD